MEREDTKTPNPLFQIIDGNGEFTDQKNLSESLGQAGFISKGFDYYVVAILGAQSSGKSTLLNLLFGTGFQVMESQSGRTQTTQGVWMGISSSDSPKKDALLVLDVEGTDSRERGEKHASFEQKTSLFSLALAEVLIVNMWHNDVGRYNAGNIALLKIVFEQNLRLFQKNKSSKTLILFIIRDHVAKETPLEKLQNSLMKDMKDIWASLIKPEEFNNSVVEDFFEFQFTGLPHKVLAEEEFYRQAGELRKRFTDPENPAFILSHRAHSKDIPADGFSAYAAGIWQTIKDNRDLDIPTQKEMLAMYRCDEIIQTIMIRVNEALKGFTKTLANSELIEKFGEKGSQLIVSSLAEYDEPASRYHPEVAAKKRATLKANITSELNGIFLKQIRICAEKALSVFEKTIKGSLPVDGTASTNFSSVSSQAILATTQYFGQKAEESTVADCDWSFDQEFDSLKDQIAKRVEEIKESQLVALMKEMKRLAQNSLHKPVDRFLSDPEDNFWPKIRTIFSEVSSTVLSALSTRLNGFDVENEEVESRGKELERIIFHVLKEKLIDHSKHLDVLLYKKFETAFNTDSDGLPRRWKPKDDIPQIFKEAKQKTEQLIERYAIIRLDPALDEVKYLEFKTETSIDPELVVLNEQQCASIKTQFEKDTKSAYLQALRDQENVSTTAHIPAFIFLLLIILGFDEFLHIITNPLLLVLTVTIGGGLYVMHMLNLGGPAQKVLTTLLQTSLTGVQHWLKDQMEKKEKKD